MTPFASHAVVYTAVMAPTPVSRSRYLAKVLRRRTRWLESHGPCQRCGSWHNLQVHHRDQTQKVSHRIWTWSPARRATELAKCEPMCRGCHIAIHALLNRKPHGMSGYRRGCRCDVCRAAIAPQIERQRLRRLAEQGIDPAVASRGRAEHAFRDQYAVVHKEE